MKWIRPALALFVVCFSQIPAYAEGPWAVLTGQSVIQVRSGLRYLYKCMGRKDLVAALDSAGATNLITGNLRGLDLNRPLGAFVLPTANGLGTFVTFIPVTGENEFRGFLERHGLTVAVGEKGLNQVHVPVLGTIVFRYDRQYAWFALTAADLDRQFPDPVQSIPAVHKKTQLAATLYVDRMPANQREVWARRADQALGFFLGDDHKTPGRLGEALAMPIAGSMVRMLADQARTVTLLAHADSKQDDLWAEMAIEPRPGTRWEEQARRLQAKPMRLDVDSRKWAKLRGVPEEKSQAMAQAVFTKPGMENIQLSMEGGEMLHLKARMSGAVLAYNAAIEKDKPPKEKRPRKHDRRRDRD